METPIEPIEAVEQQHMSDCSTNNEPALPKGECDCGPIQGKDIIDMESVRETISDIKIQLEVLAENYNKAAQASDKASKAYKELEKLICSSESIAQKITNP